MEFFENKQRHFIDFSNVVSDLIQLMRMQSVSNLRSRTLGCHSTAVVKPTFLEAKSSLQFDELNRVSAVRICLSSKPFCHPVYSELNEQNTHVHVNK